MNPNILLGSRLVSASSSPYIIAEIGVNHEGSLDQAFRLIDLAKMGGANAAKFQSYKASSLASINSPSYWDRNKESTESQFELFQKYDSFDASDYSALASHCRDIGIDFVSTPFDDDSIDFLDPMMSFYKIASADLTNTPFLRRIAAKGKPVLLSTGASTLAEIDVALKVLKSNGCEDVGLLHCILNYPTDAENAHLGMIEGLRRAYPNLVIGYSDHTMPDQNMLPLLTAYLKGAVILEKHFTHDKTLPGNDHYHAMDVDDLKRLVNLFKRTHELLGNSVHKEPIANESLAIKNARRSIVAKCNLSKGDVIKADDLTYKRPGFGISPIHWDEVIGRRVARDVEPDHILHWQDIET